MGTVAVAVTVRRSRFVIYRDRVRDGKSDQVGDSRNLRFGLGGTTLDADAKICQLLRFRI